MSFMFWFLCCLSNNYTIKREHRQIQKIRGVCWYQQKLPIVQRQQIRGSSLPEFAYKIHGLSCQGLSHQYVLLYKI